MAISNLLTYWALQQLINYSLKHLEIIYEPFINYL